MTTASTIREFARVDAALAAVRRLPPRGSLAREMRGIRRAEIVGSTALAGSRLEPGEVDALLDRGRAQGDHPFDDYILVRAYAAAADWVAEARVSAAGDARPLFNLDEMRGLHARAVAGSSLRGGAWRQGNPALASGIVAPAPWLVARETTALIDRFGRGPQGEPIPLWLARFYGRFARLLPFEGANGRVTRLAGNLLLRRLDVAPLVFERRDRRHFAGALTAAETGDPAPLARQIGTAIVRSANRLIAAAETEARDVLPLRSLAGADYGALAKAAQRGRLRTIVRGGRYFTTAAWIADYHGASSRVGQRPTHPKTSLTDG